MAKRPLLKRARLEAGLRYGPEIRALEELAADAQGQYRQGVRAEKGAAAGIRAALKEARPQMAAGYDQALAGAGVARQDVDRATAGLGASADPFRAVIARERGGAETRLRASRADSLRELSERGVDAEAGRAYAIQNLRGQLRQDMTKIGRQRQGLESEIGQFTRATFGELKDAQAKLDLENRKFDLDVAAENRQSRKTDADITGIDPATGKRTAAERNRQRDDRNGGKGGPSRGAISKHQTLLGDIQDAKATVGRLKKAGSELPSIGQVMTLPKSQDNPYGGYGPLVTRAAVELERDGALSRGTFRQLRSRGLLRGRTPGPWRPGSTRARNRVSPVLGGVERGASRIAG